MPRSIRAITNIAVLVLLAGCAEILGTHGGLDADVLADLRPDGTVVLTVRNNQRHAIRLNESPCAVRMERREGSEWIDPDSGVGCPYILILTRIEPGEVHTVVAWDTSDSEPGEYRFRVSFMDGEDEKALPGSPRASNTFVIEGARSRVADTAFSGRDLE